MGSDPKKVKWELRSFLLVVQVGEGRPVSSPRDIETFALIEREQSLGGFQDDSVLDPEKVISTFALYNAHPLTCHLQSLDLSSRSDVTK